MTEKGTGKINFKTPIFFSMFEWGSSRAGKLKTNSKWQKCNYFSDQTLLHLLEPRVPIWHTKYLFWSAILCSAFVHAEPSFC